MDKCQWPSPYKWILSGVIKRGSLGNPQLLDGSFWENHQSNWMTFQPARLPATGCDRYPMKDPMKNPTTSQKISPEYTKRISLWIFPRKKHIPIPLDPHIILSPSIPLP